MHGRLFTRPVPSRSRLSRAVLSSALVLLVSLATGCGPTLDLGSNLIWATDHESGLIDDWSSDGKGGLLDDTTVEIADGPAHSGKYALKLTDAAMSDEAGPGVYRELSSPPDAYYSAWYYLPALYQTNSQWTI